MTERDLDRLELKNPCPKRWTELEGDGPRRFCGECRLHVTHLSLLTRARAQEVLDGAEGRTCLAWETLPGGGIRFAGPGRRGTGAGWLRRAASLLFGLLPFLAGCREGPVATAEEPSAVPAEGEEENVQEVVGEVDAELLDGLTLMGYVD